MQFWRRSQRNSGLTWFSPTNPFGPSAQERSQPPNKSIKFIPGLEVTSPSTCQQLLRESGSFTEEVWPKRIVLNSLRSRTLMDFWLEVLLWSLDSSISSRAQPKNIYDMKNTKYQRVRNSFKESRRSFGYGLFCSTIFGTSNNTIHRLTCVFFGIFL